MRRYCAAVMSNTTGFGPAPAEHREDPAAHRALTGCVLALLIIWTLLGNLAVCAAVGRYRHLRAKATNIFIVSLALSDLLVAVLVMPWKAVAEVVGFWPFGAFCKTWLSLDIMCSTASILNLCVVSVDRYWAISSPFRYERTMDRKVAFVMIGVIWTVSAVISFLPVQLDWHRAEIAESSADFAHGGETNDGICDSSLSRTYAISSSLISFYIPVAIMVVTYTRIYQIAQTQIRMISSLERAAERARSCRSDAAEPCPHLCSEISANSYQTRVRVRSNSLRFNHVELTVSIRKETKVLKTLSLIMGVFVCCWLPFFVLNCALPFCPAPGASAGALCVGEKTFDVFVWIGWSNSSLNPIIYAFNADFRDAFLRLLRWRRCGCGCCPAVCAAVETVVSVNEGAQLKQDSSVKVRLRESGANQTRGSEDSGHTTVTVCTYRRSEQVTDPKESGNAGGLAQMPI